MRRDAMRFVVLATIVAALAVAMLIVRPDRAALVDAVHPSGPLAPAVAVVGTALLTAAFVPRTLLSVVGGLLFGWLSGAGYVLVGVTVGAVAAFAIGRVLGREFVARYLRGRLLRVEQAVSGRGALSVTISRLIPLVPFGVSNYAFGTTSIGFVPFVAGTVLGAMPATVAYAALGAATAAGDTGAMRTWMAVALVLGASGVLGTYLVWRRRPRVTGREPVRAGPPPRPGPAAG
jgi:uncharacterized membrane protein YdjX (TVP38/TMEM64 family)